MISDILKLNNDISRIFRYKRWGKCPLDIKQVTFSQADEVGSGEALVRYGIQKFSFLSISIWF